MASLGDLLAYVGVVNEDFLSGMKQVSDSIGETADQSEAEIARLNKSLESIKTPSIGTAGQQVRDDIKKTGDEVEKTVQKSNASLEEFGNKLKTFGHGLAALELGKKIIEFSDAALVAQKQIDDMHDAFVALNGATAETEKLFQALDDMAGKSPFQLNDVAEGAKRMLQLGMTTQDTLKAMQAIIDTVHGLNMAPSAIGAISKALATVSQGAEVGAKAMNQLTRDGIPAWDLLAKKIGVDTRQAQEQFKQGAIDGATAVGAVIDGLTNKYGGSADKWYKSWRGAWKGVGEDAEKAMQEVGRSITSALDKTVPLILAFSKAITYLIDEFKKLPGPVKDFLILFGGMVALFTVVANKRHP